MTTTTAPQPPPLDDALVDKALLEEESYTFDCKRLRDKLAKILETVVAFANSDGGVIALGLEDPDKAQGRDRVYGIQENLMSWDELRRLMLSRITESGLLAWKPHEVGCTLRDGAIGSVVFLRIEKSTRIHSIVDDGTFRRLDKGNKQLTAPEINELSFARGTITAESQLESVDFDLLDTDCWRAYAQQRRLTRPIGEAMLHVGLAKRSGDGRVLPTRAAVLLFAEEPSGLLASKAAVRIFHYRGHKVQTDPNTNLLKPPSTISGPVIRQIQDATEVVVRELASGIQMGSLGFEIVQRYPVRVIKEAITNAVIHRDYHLMTDVRIRIFSDHIERGESGPVRRPDHRRKHRADRRVQPESIAGQSPAGVPQPAQPRRGRRGPYDVRHHAGNGALSADLPDATADRAAGRAGPPVQREPPLALGAGQRLH